MTLCDPCAWAVPCAQSVRSRRCRGGCRGGCHGECRL